MLEKPQFSFKSLSPFLSKLSTGFLILFLIQETVEFSISPYYSYKLFLLEISFLLINLLFDVFLMKKKPSPLKLLLKLLLNLFQIVIFIEFRIDFFMKTTITYHKIHLIYVQFWLISLCLSFKILKFKKLRFLTIFLQYCYFKFRVLFLFDFDKDFFIENLFVFIFFILCYKIEEKLKIFSLEFLQELENYKTLFKLSDLSTEGIAIINEKHDILYSSSGFNKAFLPNEVKEQPVLSLNEIFLHKNEDSSQNPKNKNSSLNQKNVNSSQNKKKMFLTINQLKNLKLYKEIEDLNILSPMKTRKKKMLSLDTYDKSFINDLKKQPVSLQDSHLLINEGVDSEENLLLKLNRSKISQKTKIITAKTVIIPEKEKKEEKCLFLNEILEKLFKNEEKRESIETLPGNLSGNELFNSKNHVNVKPPQFDHILNIKPNENTNNLQIDQKPLVFFFPRRRKTCILLNNLNPFSFSPHKRSFYHNSFSFPRDFFLLYGENRAFSREIHKDNVP